MESTPYSLLVCFFFFLHWVFDDVQKGRINCVGRDLKTLLIPNPPRGRDIFHEPRLFQTPPTPTNYKEENKTDALQYRHLSPALTAAGTLMSLINRNAAHPPLLGSAFSSPH